MKTRMNRYKIFVVALAGLCFAFAGNVTAENPALPVIPTNTFNVTKYGGVGDGKTLNTVAIQKTIDAASAAGGGCRGRRAAWAAARAARRLHLRLRLRCDRPSRRRTHPSPSAGPARA